MAPGDATVDIPLNTVVKDKTHHPLYSENPSRNATFIEQPITMEKNGLFNRHRGKRRLRKVDSKGQPLRLVGHDAEEVKVTRMGVIYNKVLNFSIVTRYFIYVAPLASCIAIPIILGATAAKDAKFGGVKLVWFFTWLEIVWLSLWISKLVAKCLPYIFQSIMGVVSAGTRKYALVINALEIPLSIVGWAVTSLATFIPLMTRNPDTLAAAQRDPTAADVKTWQAVLNNILAALMISSLIYLAERLLIQLISINYHRKQFDEKIKASKRNVHLLTLLYEASREMFPAYCKEFLDEDYAISGSYGSSTSQSRNRSGSATPMRLFQDVGRFGDKITAAFGSVAHEITGKQVFNINSPHSVVVDALEKKYSSEALARRIWMSFVVEGSDALLQADITEVLGNSREEDAQECFQGLDRDGNGDISLDEMIQTVADIARERKAIASSMHDVDQAINVLDRLLCTVVFVLCIFVLVAWLNTNFVTTLATAGTALLSLSFVFATTAQEVLGSCIFLFVKHPYDIGDRVDVTGEQLIVEHISLLFTGFIRVGNNKTIQIPNIVLNSLWIENVTRSKHMREQVSVSISFETPFEDIQLFKIEMQKFVTDKENSREFQPDVEVEVVDVAEMNKIELRVDLRYKGNWHNETLRASRRSKFMCAMVMALRRIPIYGPVGGDALLGSESKPTYSVCITDAEAAKAREEFAAAREASRLYQHRKPPADTEGAVATDTAESRTVIAGQRVVASLTTPSPVVDVFTRDETWNSPDNSTLGRPSMERQDAEEIRGALLQRNITRGKRPRGGTAGQFTSPIREPHAYNNELVFGQPQYSTSSALQTLLPPTSHSHQLSPERYAPPPLRIPGSANQYGILSLPPSVQPPPQQQQSRSP